MRPGRPFAFGPLGAGPDGITWLFALPGNPVSSLVSFEVLARPALRKMAGHRHIGRSQVRGIADVAFRRQPDGKTHLVRATATFGPDGRLHVRPVGAQGSHQLAASATATGSTRTEVPAWVTWPSVRSARRWSMRSTP